MAIVDTLSQITNDEASDIFVVAGLPLSYKSHGVLKQFAEQKMMPADTAAMITDIYQLAGERDMKRLMETGNYNYDAVMDVLYPFGHGLSYTRFDYSNLQVDKTDFTAADSLVFTVDVRNSGDRVGKEAVLLFVSDLVATLTPDNTRLRTFQKIELQPGEQQTVRLAIAAKDLAFVGSDLKWRLEEGEFMASVGRQSLKVNCTATKVWDTPNI